MVPWQAESTLSPAVTSWLEIRAGSKIQGLDKMIADEVRDDTAMADVDTTDLVVEDLAPDGSLDSLDDAQLLSLAREGNQDAYGALFARYSYAAHRLARHLGQREDSDDVVAEAFAQVLDLVRRGKGPDRAFRAYLFTTIRHEAGRRAKAQKRVMPTDDEHTLDEPVQFGGGDLDQFERTAVRAAYESLPERWRTVLWHLDVEGRKPQELGPLLDLSANSVSALVYRARAGLREAYLARHLNPDADGISDACATTRDILPALVRGTASTRDIARAQSHLEGCETCRAAHADLVQVNLAVG